MKEMFIYGYMAFCAVFVIWMFAREIGKIADVNRANRIWVNEMERNKAFIMKVSRQTVKNGAYLYRSAPNRTVKEKKEQLDRNREEQRKQAQQRHQELSNNLVATIAIF